MSVLVLKALVIDSFTINYWKRKHSNGNIWYFCRCRWF